MTTKVEGIRVNKSVVKGFVAFSRVVGWILVLVSFVMLATWITGKGPLREFMQGSSATSACASFGFLLSGCALLLGTGFKHSRLVLLLVVTMLGGTRLLEFLTGQNMVPWEWIDRFLTDWTGRPAGRMTELSAVSFVLMGAVGTAILLERALWFREACVLLVIAIATASSASYRLVLAGESENLLHRQPLMTATLLLLLAFGWMSAVPTTGLTRITVADSLGGAFARRLIIPALLLPVVLTFLFKWVQSSLGMSESLALALAAVATGGGVTVMIILVAFFMDRSERQRRTVRALRADANTDGLTGLANRRAFDASLLESLQDEEGVVVLMLDLDHFKSFNDTFGHPAGDEVLCETGRLLRAEVRPGDLAARYGGEEFIIVLSQSDSRRAGRVGQRILDAFHAWPWADRPITVSIGGAVAEPGDTPEALVQRADDALYRSKQEGRDRLTFAPTVVEPAPPHLQA